MSIRCRDRRRIGGRRLDQRRSDPCRFFADKGGNLPVKTALRIAAKGRSLAIVQELLKKHANLKHTKMDSTVTAGRRGLALCSDNMEGALY
jgi:hypothetical protein